MIAVRERSARVLAREISSKLMNEGVPVHPVSLRDGFVVVAVGRGENRVMVWIRTSPITKKSCELAKKIIGKYQHKKSIVLEFYEQADLAEPKEMHIEKVGNTDEAIETIKKHLSAPVE